MKSAFVIRSRTNQLCGRTARRHHRGRIAGPQQQSWQAPGAWTGCSVVPGDTDRSYDFAFVGRLEALQSRHMDGITTTRAGPLPSQIGPKLARNVNQRASDHSETGNAWTALFSSFGNPGDRGHRALVRLGPTVLAAHARSRELGVAMQKGGLRPGTPQPVTAHSVCAQPLRGYSKLLLIVFVQQRARQTFSSWAAEEQGDGNLGPRPDLDTDAGERQRSSPGLRGC